MVTFGAPENNMLDSALTAQAPSAQPFTVIARLSALRGVLTRARPQEKPSSRFAAPDAGSASCCVSRAGPGTRTICTQLRRVASPPAAHLAAQLRPCQFKRNMASQGTSKHSVQPTQRESMLLCVVQQAMMVGAQCNRLCMTQTRVCARVPQARHRHSPKQEAARPHQRQGAHLRGLTAVRCFLVPCSCC